MISSAENTLEFHPPLRLQEFIDETRATPRFPLHHADTDAKLGELEMMIQGATAQALTSALCHQSTRLSAEQAKKLTADLSDFDAENLSDDAEKEI